MQASSVLILAGADAYLDYLANFTSGRATLSGPPAAQT